MTSPDVLDDPQPEPLRALFVGLGSIGQRHARNLRTLLGDRVVFTAYRATAHSPVITERLRPVAGRSIEAEYGVQSYTSLDDALAARPNVAFICNPTSLHIEPALACANAGCDLFIEKPISHTLDGLDRLAAVAQANGLVVAVGSQLRFHPALQLMKRLIDAGEIGRVLAVRAEVGEYLPGWHPYEDYRESYAGRRSLGGGVILTLIHEIDYLAWIFGMPRRLFAVGGHLSDLEIDVEDVASILAACLHDGAEVPVHLQMDYLQRPPRRTCAVLGERGSLDLDLRHNRLTLIGSDERVQTLFNDPQLDRNVLFLEQLSDFLAARATRSLPRVTLADGMAALHIALGVHESIRTRCPVEL